MAKRMPASLQIDGNKRRDESVAGQPISSEPREYNDPPSDFVGLMDVLRAAEQFDPSPAPMGEVPASSPSGHTGRHDRSVPRQPISSGPREYNDPPNDFVGLMDVLRAAQQFDTSPAPMGEVPASSPSEDTRRHDRSVAGHPISSGPREGNDPLNDFVGLMDVLRGAQPSEPSPSLARHEESVRVRLPADFSMLESSVLSAVARSLASVEWCVSLVRHESSWSGAQAIRDLTSTEMTRAATMLQLLRFLKGDYRPLQTPLSMSAVIQRVIRLADSERRLRGIVVSTPSSFGDARTMGDEVLLSQVLLSLLLTTFTLLPGVKNPAVTLAIDEGAGGACIVSIVQAQTSARPAWAAHSEIGISPIDTDQAFRLIALRAGHRMAEACGGRFAAVAGEGSTKLSMSLPSIKSIPA
jgi:hypothetical protein